MQCHTHTLHLYWKVTCAAQILTGTLRQPVKVMRMHVRRNDTTPNWTPVPLHRLDHQSSLLPACTRNQSSDGRLAAHTGSPPLLPRCLTSTQPPSWRSPVELWRDTASSGVPPCSWRVVWLRSPDRGHLDGSLQHFHATSCLCRHARTAAVPLRVGSPANSTHCFLTSSHAPKLRVSL